MTTDVFTRANESPLASPWAAVAGMGTLKLASNAVTATTASTDCAMYHSTSSVVDDSEVTIGTVGGADGGPALFDPATGNGYVCAINGANIAIYKFVGGAFSSTISTAAGSWTTGDDIRLRRSAGNLLADKNGANVITVAEGTYTNLKPAIQNFDGTQTVTAWTDNAAPATPTLTEQPEGASAPVAGTTTYSVTSPDATSYQWQVSTNGGETWANVSDGSGGTTSTFTTAAAIAAHNGRKYRCVLTNANGDTNSLSAWFFVSGLPSTGKGARGKGSAWSQLAARDLGRINKELIGALRPSFGNSSKADAFPSAWRDWFIPAADPVPPVVLPTDLNEYAQSARNRPGSGPFSTGRFYIAPRQVTTAAAGVSTGATGLATETDTALNLGAVQLRATGLASEADTALNLASARPAGQATETDTALATAGVQLRATGIAAEADTAFVTAALQIRAVGLAIETDTALALSPGATSAVGLAIETDTALTLGAARPAGLATEADAALATAALQIRATGLATEADTALATAPVQIRATGLAIETDTALALSPGINGQVGVAVETDTALALSARQVKATGLATEADTALALTVTVARSVGVAIELDAAFARAAVAQRLVGRSDEADTAFALFAPGAIQVGRANETDTAFALIGESLTYSIDSPGRIGPRRQHDTAERIGSRNAIDTAERIGSRNASATTRRIG